MSDSVIISSSSILRISRYSPLNRQVLHAWSPEKWITGCAPVQSLVLLPDNKQSDCLEFSFSQRAAPAVHTLMPTCAGRNAPIGVMSHPTPKQMSCVPRYSRAPPPFSWLEEATHRAGRGDLSPNLGLTPRELRSEELTTLLLGADAIGHPGASGHGAGSSDRCPDAQPSSKYSLSPPMARSRALPMSTNEPNAR